MSLCLDCGCGLCCDGTLYPFAPLKAEDFPILTPLFDVRIKPENAPPGSDEALFALPCKLCLNDSCSIHGQERPAMCAEYRCILLFRHENGKVSTEEACALISNVKMLRDRIRPHIEQFVGAESALSLAGQISLMVAKLEAPDSPPAHPKMLLDVAMLRVLLAKHFDSRLMMHTYMADKALQTMSDASEPGAKPEDNPET